MPEKHFSQQGIHELIASTLKHIDTQFRLEYAKNVILTGRTACLAGLHGRLKKELGQNVNIVFSERDSAFGSWRGAAILAKNLKPEKWFSR